MFKLFVVYVVVSVKLLLWWLSLCKFCVIRCVFVVVNGWLYVRELFNILNLFMLILLIVLLWFSFFCVNLFDVNIFMLVSVCVVNVLCILIKFKLVNVILVLFKVIGVECVGFISMFLCILIVEKVKLCI